jgi:Leucine-rich repeat (LRR) protein
MERLTTLTNINLSNNLFDRFPSQLKSLPQLTSLDLSRNYLRNIDSLEGFAALTNLNVGYNRLTDFPPVGDLRLLSSLNISNNFIPQLPPGFEQLHALQAVYFQGNPFGLPLGIEQLQRLERLHIVSTYFEEVEVVTLANYQHTPITGETAYPPNITDLGIKESQYKQLPQAIKTCANYSPLKNPFQDFFL